MPPEKRETEFRLTLELSYISDTFANTAYTQTAFSFDFDGSGSETRAGHPVFYTGWSSCLQGASACVHKHAVRPNLNPVT